MSNGRVTTTRVMIGLAVLLLLAAMPAMSQDKDDPGPPTPIGAWFGIARPCVYPTVGFPTSGGVPVADPAPDATICGLAGASKNVFPLLQVTMIPTLLADGTVLADDFGELLDHHTTAQGKWEKVGKVTVDGKQLDKYQATFIWFSGPLAAFGDPANPAFIGSIRPRFVTFFDKNNPDDMRGYIQPYLYRYTKADDEGIGTVNFDASGKFPTPNPAAALPTTCNPSDTTANPRCLGTLHFYIHRIPAH